MSDEANDRYYAFIPQTTTHSKQLNKLQATTRWLYVILIAERHGSDEPFKAPYKRLHKITGFSTSTIKRGIEELQQAGFLVYEHGGLRNPNLYNLEGSWLELDREPSQLRSRRRNV